MGLITRWRLEIERNLAGEEWIFWKDGDVMARAGVCDDECVFIVGPPRAGTTMLRLILNESEEMGVPAETWFFPKLLRRVKTYGGFEDERGLRVFAQHVEIAKAETAEPFGEVFKVGRDEIFEVLREAKVGNYAEAYGAVMGFLVGREQKERWGDKSTFYTAYLKTLGAAYPRAKFVGLVRDPRDVVRSIHDTEWGKRTYGDFMDAGYRWRYGVEGIVRGEKVLGDRMKVIRYEDFVENAEEGVRELCDFVGLEFREEMLMFYRRARRKVPTGAHQWQKSTTKPISGDRIGLWRGQWIDEDLARVEGVCGGLMRRFGYEAEGSGGGLKLRREMLAWQAKRVGRGLFDKFHWSCLLRPE